MPAIYSTLIVSEPDYGERFVRAHGGVHHSGVSQTYAIDLVTGQRLPMPISTRWDHDAQRMVPVTAHGWPWRPIPLAAAERRAGLPAGSLPPYSDSARSDLWVDERIRNPAFIVLLTVLTAHPEVVFYFVDWRSWVHLQAPPEHPLHHDSPLLTTPSQSDRMEGERHLPYPLGGSGDMERYASSLSRHLAGASSPAVIRTPDTVDTLSEAVLADLHQEYDSIVAWQQNPEPTRRLHRGPADMPAVRSPSDIQALTCWTPELLAELDDLYEQTQARHAEETADYRPQSFALSLF